MELGGWLQCIVGGDGELQTYADSEMLCQLINELAPHTIPFIRTDENTSVKFLKDFDNTHAFLKGLPCVGSCSDG